MSFVTFLKPRNAWRRARAPSSGARARHPAWVDGGLPALCYISTGPANYCDRKDKLFGYEYSSVSSCEIPARRDWLHTRHSWLGRPAAAGPTDSDTSMSRAGHGAAPSTSAHVRHWSRGSVPHTEIWWRRGCRHAAVDRVPVKMKSACALPNDVGSE